LRQHPNGEGAQKRVDARHDFVTPRHLKRAAGAEIVLQINHDQRLRVVRHRHPLQRRFNRLKWRPAPRQCLREARFALAARGRTASLAKTR